MSRRWKKELVSLEDWTSMSPTISILALASLNRTHCADVAMKGKNKLKTLSEFTYAGSLNKLIDCQIVDNCKKGLGKNTDAPIIEEWVLDDEDEEIIQPKFKQKTVKTSIAKIKFVKPKQPEKKARKTVKQFRKTVKQVEKTRKNTHIPRGNQRNWNNMLSQR
nr:hypothetical protein [Tanacetum cinerariifolium]